MEPENILVPASAGWHWFKLGWTTFWRQPLLFALLCGLQLLSKLLLENYLPWDWLAPFVTPAFTLAVMDAAARCIAVQQPGPALQPEVGRDRKLLQAMLMLGAMLAVGSFCLNAALYVLSSTIVVMDPPGNALLAVLWHLILAQWWLLLSLVPSTLLWHAPALVYWHGLPPLAAGLLSVKSCLSNWRAGLLLGLVWLGLVQVPVVGVVLATACCGVLPDMLMKAALLIPLSVLMLANFFCFRDCFSAPSEPPLCAAPGFS